MLVALGTGLEYYYLVHGTQVQSFDRERKFSLFEHFAKTSDREEEQHAFV